MATSSLTGGQYTPRQPSGTDLGSLGPSDLSDSGSDGVGAYDPQALEGDSDSLGTGERSSAQGLGPTTGADILPDHLEVPNARRDETQAELDFDEVAEQGEGAVGQDLAPADDPRLDDTPADVGGLSQDDESDAAEGDQGDS